MLPTYVLYVYSFLVRDPTGVIIVSLCDSVSYLIGQIVVKQKIRHIKFVYSQHFRHICFGQNFRHYDKVLSILSEVFFSGNVCLKRESEKRKPFAIA